MPRLKIKKVELLKVLEPFIDWIDKTTQLQQNLRLKIKNFKGY